MILLRAATRPVVLLIAGEHEDWEDYRRAMVDEQRCLLRISLARAGPDRAG